MKVNIHSDETIKQQIKDSIIEKMKPLERVYSRMISSDVFLKEDQDAEHPKKVEIKISMPGPYLFAESSSDTYEKAIVETIKKIRRQLVKRKENMTSHR